MLSIGSMGDAGGLGILYAVEKRRKRMGMQEIRKRNN